MSNLSSVQHTFEVVSVPNLSATHAATIVQPWSIGCTVVMMWRVRFGIKTAFKECGLQLKNSASLGNIVFIRQEEGSAENGGQIDR